MRSRAVRRPLACWLSIALAPPPSQIFSPSLRICDMRSARNRILASKRADVGSTLVVRTSDGEGELAVGSSVRSAMGRRFEQRTDYGITAEQGGATRPIPETADPSTTEKRSK